MKLGAVSAAFLNKSLDEVAAYYQRLGLSHIELGAGGYFPKGHCNPRDLLADEAGLKRFVETLASHELKLSALAIHGEPLHPDPKIAGAFADDLRDACKLAEKLEIDRITLLAGLPEATPGDRAPNWIPFPFPPRNADYYEWQWEQRLIPYWKQHGRIAEDHGVRLCFEMVPGDMVFNPATMLRLREAVGPVVGCNYDPSHLFPLGIDTIEAIDILGEAIYHVHAKDTGINPRVMRMDGAMDMRALKHVRDRSWNYRTVGYGHDELYWREFVSALRTIGYDDVISIEHEDRLIEPEEGFELAVRLLKGVMPEKPGTALWDD